MMIVTRNRKPAISTRMIAEKVGISHQSIKRLIERKKIPVLDVGFVSACANESDQKKRKKGGQIQELFLTEESALYIASCLKNTDQFVGFKEELVRQFIERGRLRTFYSANRQWIAKKPKKKKFLANELHQFLVYSDSGKYFMSASKLTDSDWPCLDFILLKYAELGNIVSKFGNESLNIADRLVAKIFEEGTESYIPCEDILNEAKERIRALAQCLGVIPYDPEIIAEYRNNSNTKSS